MTKNEMMELVKKYDMFSINEHITGKHLGYGVQTLELIPELDQYADTTAWNPVVVNRVLNGGNGYTYSVYPPSNWLI